MAIGSEPQELEREGCANSLLTDVELMCTCSVEPAPLRPDSHQLQEPTRISHSKSKIIQNAISVQFGLFV